MRGLLWPMLGLALAAGMGCDGGDDDDDVTDDDSAGDDDTEPTACDDGVPAQAWSDAEPDASLYATAADFTATTTEGTFSLRDSWTGCDSTLIIPDSPRQTDGWPTPLWDRDVDELFERLPDNTVLLFCVDSSDEGTVEATLDGLRLLVDAELEAMDDDDAERWRGRIHYVTDPCREMEGWVGEINTSPRWGVGIDRFQRIRYIGSFADWARYDGDQGWFAPNLSMAANEAVYYNYEAARETRLAGEDATVVRLLDDTLVEDPGWSGERISVDVALPDAETMASFDSAELDLTLACDGDGEYGTCPAWDYIATLYLCDADDPDSCSTEFGRWITTYHREGRWVHDVTPLLALIREGGTRRFQFYTQQPYLVTLDLRLFDRGTGVTPQEATYLFSGGTFDSDYNTGREPVSVTIPADAVKVEIASAITGHGMSSMYNCAEFCDTTHYFYVNGDEYSRAFDDPGAKEGCLDQVGEGTVPNQYGTWWYGRNGWCPGKQVDLGVIDVTSSVVPGGENVIEYAGYLNDDDVHPNDGANIVMTSWIVVSR